MASADYLLEVAGSRSVRAPSVETPDTDTKSVSLSLGNDTRQILYDGSRVLSSGRVGRL